MEKFRASTAARHMQCHASAHLDIAIEGWQPPVEDPDADTAANRGTELHARFADVMSHTPKDVKNFSEALAYVVEVQKRRRFKKLVEAPVKAAWLASAPYVTADLVLYVMDEMHVFDLKTGGIRVDVEYNKQLMFYAATYEWLAPKAKGIHLHIVQPWADNCESWYLDSETLVEFMTEAQETEQAIRNGSTIFTPGDACTFCPANPHGRGSRGTPSCPAMLSILYPEILDENEILKGI